LGFDALGKATMADHRPIALDEMYAMRGYLIRWANQISTALFNLWLRRIASP
jgi:hypothetical protein